MKINKIANEQNMPEWASQVEGTITDVNVFTNVDRLTKEVDTEKTIEQEMEEIERRASAGQPYYYSSALNQRTASELREYAIVCGIDKDKIISVDPEAYQKVASTTESMVKVASREIERSPASDLSVALGDPFKIDEKLGKETATEEWEKITKSKQLNQKGNMDVRGPGVYASRGPENYFENSFAQTARGQNSLDNPNAIKEYAESEGEDTGARLKREHEEKSAQKVANNKEWEDDKIAAMPFSNIVAKGKVFPTEIMNAQNGLDHAPAHGGVYAKPTEMPNRTAGEQISEQNLARKESIQREVQEKAEFEPQTQSARGISDTFADSLKASLGKING